jgi:hypothetical protein
MCTPIADTGTRNRKSICPAAEDTASATAVGGSTNEVSQALLWDHSALVSAQ